MIRIIEIKTADCIKCKMLQPLVDTMLARLEEEHSGSVEYLPKILPQDQDVIPLAMKYNIKAAPAFILQSGDIEKLVDFEDLEKSINNLL